MFDDQLMFWDADEVTSTSDSDTLAIAKTPVDGVDVGLSVTQVSGTNPTLDVTVKDANGAVIATFPQITAAGVYYTKRIQTNTASVKMAAVVGGTNTPTFKITAGIVSGPEFYSQ